MKIACVLISVVLILVLGAWAILDGALVNLGPHE